VNDFYLIMNISTQMYWITINNVDFSNQFSVRGAYDNFQNNKRIPCSKSKEYLTSSENYKHLIICKVTPQMTLSEMEQTLEASKIMRELVS